MPHPGGGDASRGPSLGDPPATSKAASLLPGRSRPDPGASATCVADLPCQSQGGGLCTQRPPTIVATTSRVEVVPRVAVEHDEVGGVAREQPAAAALVAGQPRRRDAGRLRTPARRSAPAPDATLPARRSCAARRRGCPRAGRAPRSARRSRSRRPRPSRAASGTRRRRRSSRPRSGRRGRGRTARARTAPTRRRRARAKRGDVLGREQLRVLDPLPQPERRATRPRVCSNASSASRFARSPIACTATGQPALAPRRGRSRPSSSPLVICDAAAVEHPRRPRAERAVHEHLQVAEPQAVARRSRSAARARAAASSRSCGSDCQTRSVSAPARSSRCQSPSAPSQPSLSCTAVTPRERASFDAGAHRVEVLVVRHAQVPLLEPPRRLLAQHAGRLAALVALDDAARDLEVAVRRARARPS